MQLESAAEPAAAEPAAAEPAAAEPVVAKRCKICNIEWAWATDEEKKSFRNHQDYCVKKHWSIIIIIT